MSDTHPRDQLVKPLYNTPYGTAYVGDSLTGVRELIDDESVQLFVTSPPFALRRKKEYGNKPADQYITWFREFAEVFWDKLKTDGSLVVDLGGAWNKGTPTRSLYQYKLLIELCEGLGNKSFHLAQEFFWYNPAKMPSPAQWVTIDRIRVKDAVNVVWWLSKTDRPKANNRNVLQPYSRAMERLLARQTYNSGRRPSGHVVSDAAWNKRNGGAIPANQFSEEFDALSEPENVSAIAQAVDGGINWLEIPNTTSNGAYHDVVRAVRKLYEDRPDELRAKFRNHPARFPSALPAFFIEFLSEPGDLVVDPFAGSNVSGAAAEQLERRWRAFELHQYYLEPSLARFDPLSINDIEWFGDAEPVLAELSRPA